jgi:hypothetical protein
MSNHAYQSVTNVESTVLNFSDVYLSHLSKIKACIRKLDHKAGFKRSTDQINELAQDFFTKVWADNILDYFDLSRAKSKDAILAYLYNHLRNFYSSVRTKEIRYAETKKKLTEVSTLGLRSNSNLFGTKHDEDPGFCHDIHKVGKAFVKSLRGKWEKKAWKMFIHDEASAETVANELGISTRTSFRLKDTINSKAKMYLKGYYAGSLTLN